MQMKQMFHFIDGSEFVENVYWYWCRSCRDLLRSFKYIYCFFDDEIDAVGQRRGWNWWWE
jgi:hypothetical protein